MLGPERERLRAFEHIIFETHPFITGVSDEELLASLKELGFECRLHITLEPKLGQNIYTAGTWLASASTCSLSATTRAISVMY